VENQIIYHYTNLDSALAILKSKCIWASCSDYLNDYREITYTTIGFKDFLQEKAKGLKDKSQKKHIDKMLSYYFTNPEEKRKQIFITSFSGSPDLLSQWRGYADDGYGLSIGFNINELKLPIAALNTGIADYDYYLIKVNYSEDEKNAFFEYLFQFSGTDGFWLDDKPAFYNLESVLDNIISLSPSEVTRFRTFNILEKTSPALKDKCFQEENEWRIVKYAKVHEYINGKVPADFNIRSNGRGLIPYFTLNISERTIANIVVGPKADYKKIYYALRMIESKYGHSFAISKSNITYI